MNKLLEMLLDVDESTNAILAAIYVNERIQFNELAKTLEGEVSRQTISNRLKKLVEYDILTSTAVKKANYAIKAYEFSKEFKKQKEYGELYKRYLNKSY